VDDINAIAEALYKTETCHHGKDGIVAAIAPIAESEYYAPAPLLISASCKRETGQQLTEWLKMFIQVYKDHPDGEKTHGPIRTIASDGEASFRTARFLLCTTQDLDPNSELGKILYKLPGLNCQIGADGLLGTCDPKHIFKRFATLIHSPSGTLVNDTNIYPGDVLENLVAMGKHVSDAKELLNPSDKQNVPKAVRLLQSLKKLENVPLPPLPANAQCRHKVIFMGRVFSYFLNPFIQTTMDLSSQIRSLSTYAHVTAAMYLKHKLDFLTGALYADSQAIVKNITFTIAKLQLIDGKIKYYIILEGSDRLEGIFSNVRTQDHNRNADVLQFGQKLSTAAEVNATFERHPDLDRGHRQLALQDAEGIDHVNPASWKGNVEVGHVM
jgi:hypothetical protein